MTIWYRAHRSNKTTEVFSGDGGLYTAGRWNHLGNRVIYCSQSIALCTLEWLSHHGLSVSAFDYFRYSIEIPDKLIKTIAKTNLPKNWNATPATNETRLVAEELLFKNDGYLGLSVPSVLVPEECNLIVNPLHHSFKQALKSVRELGRYIAPKR